MLDPFRNKKLEIINRPAMRKPGGFRSYALAGGTLALLLAAGGILGFAIKWPFKRQMLIDALQESSVRTVTVGSFHATYFPPGCVAENIQFLRRKSKEKPPMITIRKLTIEGSYVGLIGSPKRLKRVLLEGLHVTVPPRNPDGSNPVMPLTDVKSKRPLVVGVAVADGTVLDFVSHSGKEQYHLVINHLELDGMGNGRAMGYRARFHNPEPPGEIETSGEFGPWSSDDPGRTMLTGSYVFRAAEPAVYKDVSGILSSTGKFSGTLDRMETAGQGRVEKFHVGHSAHVADLVTEYQATIDLTNGSTILKRVQSVLRRTTVIAEGSIEPAHQRPGKLVALAVSSAQGRIEDVLDTLLAAKRPAMRGAMNLRGNIALPPRDESFLHKLKVDGDFGLNSCNFSSGKVQNPLDRISQSARHEKGEDDENPETALSDVKGHVSARDGIATLSNVSFQIPGADAQIHGTFNLLTQEVDLHGVLKTKGKVYVAAQGFKSFLLRAITPLLKHESHQKVVPFKVTGTYPNASVSLDLFGKQ